MIYKNDVPHVFLHLTYVCECAWFPFLVPSLTGRLGILRHFYAIKIMPPYITHND